MFKILTIVLVVFGQQLYAATVKPVQVLDNNKGASFLGQNDVMEGAQIYVYARTPSKKLAFTAVIKIINCDLEQCEGKVFKIKKGAQLSMENHFSTTPLHIKGQKTVGDKNSAFLTLGGPIAFGYNLGYFRSLSPEFKLGVKAGIIDKEIGKVGVSGRYVALQAEYQLSKVDSWEFNPYAEVGYLQTTLDFAKINGPEFDENVPYTGVGLDVWYNMDKWFLLGKAGCSFNFYEEKYSDETADYSLPFNGGLVVFEIGVGYRF